MKKLVYSITLGLFVSALWCQGTDNAALQQPAQIEEESIGSFSPFEGSPKAAGAGALVGLLAAIHEYPPIFNEIPLVHFGLYTATGAFIGWGLSGSIILRGAYEEAKNSLCSLKNKIK